MRPRRQERSIPVNAHAKFYLPENKGRREFFLRPVFIVFFNLLNSLARYPFIQSRQDKQRQQRRSNQTTDHDGCERSLHFGSGGG